MNYITISQPGDLAQLVGTNHKYFFVRLTPGQVLQSHRGVINHDDMIGVPWGSMVTSHIGARFYLMIPALGDLITETSRNSQIMYPKDIGFVLVTMGIGPGAKVIEAGSGSGGLTTAFAYFVGESGKVFSYDIRGDMVNQAKKNIGLVGLTNRVVFYQHDIGLGFFEEEVDAVFLDVQNPEDYLEQVKKAIKPGGFFGTIVPTTNQVTRILVELEARHFAFVDVCEILLRYYRSSASRFRPVDRMVAHTGFLIFARSIQFDSND